MLNFGFSGESNSSGFLETATGVGSSLEKGYVMVRGGSITGISTNLEIIYTNSSGQVDIIIYKNGKPVGFGNTISASSIGVKNDYDIQSENTITFSAGDVISMYIHVDKGIVWRDDTTMLEITTVD